MLTESYCSDSDLLASLPDHICAGNLLVKARPDVGDRIIYVEASNEDPDMEGEVVLGKALRESAGVFEKFGVLDLDHKSMPAVAAKLGIERPEEWIIGQPLGVSFVGGTTIVKAQLRQGSSPLAMRANRVWEGLTQVTPPDRYYASVGGSVLGREIRIDPATGNKIPVITKTHWNNLALSLNPVNAGLMPATTLPLGVFTKSLGGMVVKTLEAGYGTDSAQLTGGGSLRRQSLHGGVLGYWDLRDSLSRLILKGQVSAGDPADLVRAVQGLGLSADAAAAVVERFLSDIHKRNK